MNLRMPPLTPAIRLPRKPTGSLMMSPTTPAARASTFVQHRDELTNRVDDGLDRADRLVDQALVLGLQLLDPLVEALARLDVLRRERVDDGLLLVVDVALELLELVADLLRCLGADLLQVGGQALDVGGDLGLARRDPLLRRGQVAPDDVGDPAR